MDMSIMDIVVLCIGMASTTITSVMYLPQVYKVYKTNETASLSLPTFCGSFVASCLWSLYAILMLINGYLIATTGSDPLIAALPVLVCNVILIVLMSYIIYKKVKNDKTAKLEKQNAESNIK
ncbi:MAG: SemiSWEET family sugar transporter [Mycoplasma sp.]